MGMAKTLSDPGVNVDLQFELLAIDDKNIAALQLQKKVLELEGHLNNFETAKSKKEWGMARLALDKCLQAIESEGGDIPLQWRIWRAELDIARRNLDAAAITARYVAFISCFHLAVLD